MLLDCLKSFHIVIIFLHSMMISMKYFRPGQRKRFGFCLLVLYRANTYKDTETPDFMLSNLFCLWRNQCAVSILGTDFMSFCPSCCKFCIYTDQVYSNLQYDIVTDQPYHIVCPNDWTTPLLNSLYTAA